jgi:REP element-mobilizing transposase RayT
MGAYKIYDQGAPYYLTIQIIEWVDLFTRDVYCRIVFDSLAFCQKNKGLEIYAYVLMSNHLHIIARAGNGNLSDVIRDFKAYTSKKIIDQIIEGPESRRDWILNLFRFEASKRKKNEHYQVWTHDNHPEELYSNEFIWQKLDYIHLNPVRNGLVSEPWDYRYSSARNYAKMESVLEIDLVTLKVKSH